MKWNYKRTLAGILAASMAAAVLAPAVPAQAAPVLEGSPVKVIFDTGHGPRIKEADGDLWKNTSLITSRVNTTTGTRSGEILGLAGDLYQVDPRFNPYTGDMDNYGGSYNRPKLPTWNTPLEFPEWDGYTFKGWYTDRTRGDLVTRLDPSFPYQDTTTLYARWEGSASQTYKYMIIHERLTQNRDGGNVTLNFLAKDTTGPGTTEDKSAGIGVSASRKNIPGYNFEEYDYSPKRSRRYGDGTDTGNGYENNHENGYEIKLPTSEGSRFIGTMPNDDLTVTYTYKVDTAKEFPLTIQYVDSFGDPLPGVSEKKSRWPAEKDLNLNPESVIGYIPVAKSITAGDTSDLKDRGVYSIDDIGYRWNGYEFIGKMPNQALTIVYTYDIDPDFEPALNVNYVDSMGRNLHTVGILDENLYPVSYPLTPVNPQPVRNIPVPDLTSLGYSANYNIKNIQGLTGIIRQNNEVTVTPDFGGGSLTIEYVEDVNNTAVFAQLNFRQGANGDVPGNTSMKRLRKGIYQIEPNGDIETLTGIVGTPTPISSNYIFDGWYEVDSSGNKTSSRLTEINLDRNKIIKAFFEEDPSMWYDITFVEGSHMSFGTITRTFHVGNGTVWNDIAPSLTFDSGYELDYWYDSYGRNVNVGVNPAFTESETFTVKTRSTVTIPGADVLNIPDTVGKIVNSGTGEIKVNYVDSSRKYVLTDTNGIIIAIAQGSNVKFIGLNPGSTYEVYELSTGTAVQVGDDIVQIPSSNKSSPALVDIMALGDNWTADADGNNAGKAVLVIEPAAPNTEYAVLDENGNVENGWKTSSGTPLKVEFDDLDPNKTYKVVARENGSTDTPESKAATGSNVRTDLAPVISYDKFRLKVENGTIVTVGNVPVGASEYEDIEIGTRIKIKADPAPAGKHFKEWNVRGGSLAGFTAATQEETYLNMPVRNVVVEAVYEYDTPLATPSNVIVEYTVNQENLGQIDLNASAADLEDLADDFRTPDDEDLLNVGKEVKYVIDFKKRAEKPVEFNEVKAQCAYGNVLGVAWALDVKTTRKVDGVRINGSNNNPVSFEVLAEIGNNDLNKMDYQLWEIYEDSFGRHINEISMNPDPNQDPANTRYFVFNAEPDKSYVLSYSKTNKVTICDTRTGAGPEENIIVRHGEALTGWTAPASYTDAQGIEWTFKGLSIDESVYNEYNITDLITRDIKVYIYYKSSDPAWENARTELENKIREAEDLCSGGTLSQAKKDALQAAIDEAKALLNAVPAATKEELNSGKNKLQNAIDEAKRNGPTDPNRGGGNSGGGSITKPRAGLTPGVDGDWKLINAEEHKWVFELKNGSYVSGKWATISYTYQGKTAYYWYHFSNDGIMNSGWFQESGVWYYLSLKHDGWFGSMQTGWQYSNDDKRWYYLDPVSGTMAKGWKEISGKWYYFTESNQNNTYSFDNKKNQWVYLNVSERPLGSLYSNERTPDGYQVNADGAWANGK